LALSLEDQTPQRTFMSRDVDQRALRSRIEAGGTAPLEPLLSLEAAGAGGGQRRQITEAGAAESPGGERIPTTETALLRPQ
jgi:hypothetical protein